MARGTGRPRGLLTVGAILGLGIALGLVALAGRPSAIRRPDPVLRPTLLIADFDNRTGRAELAALAARLSEGVRERLSDEPGGIFEVSPRRLRPVLSPEAREEGLLGIAGRLGADYVLAGGLESGPGQSLPPGSAWSAPPARLESAAVRGGEGVRLEVLLVSNSEPPHVFAERFPLGAPEDSEAERRRLARWVADRLALALRRP